MMPLDRIRNFCIIAHVDHGKSTLADRMLEITGTIDQRHFRDQVLDAMDLERERGITIKSHPVTMRYTEPASGAEYELNLIDTPGHVDFSYEVSRSMAACEGALLVVDATQGVEAQTVANTLLAMERGLTIIPVINKIDMPTANPEEAKRQVEDILAISMDDCFLVSARTGEGVAKLMERGVIGRIPPPSGAADGALRALVFDSTFDAFRGVVAYVRIFDGSVAPGDRVKFLASSAETEVKDIGVFAPKPRSVSRLGPGDVGYIVGTIRNPSDVRVGDTVTGARNPCSSPLPGFKDIHPMVFASLYPLNSDDYEKFRQSLEKLKLNDSAFTFHPENSAALGSGFRCGFLGLLHLEVVQERIRREFGLDIISTYPSVVHRVHMRDGSVAEIDNPAKLPDPTRIDIIEEPIIRARIITPNEAISEIVKLVRERRGEVSRTDSLDTRRVMITAVLPLNEILTEFHDALKAISRGYASFDYDHAGYQPSEIVKVDVLLNGEPVEAFSFMVHESKAAARGRQICGILKENIPPHQFAVPIQAAIGKTIIARETIRAYRKDVTAKLYGGDVTRKRKLLEKQKEGKKRMRQFGTVTVPQKAFVAVLRAGSARE